MISFVLQNLMWTEVVFLDQLRNCLSFAAIFCLIVLVGIEVKTSILLEDSTNQFCKEGKGRDEAIREAGELLFLPIVLTTVTAIREINSDSSEFILNETRFALK
jgi:multidrug efflux pump subunit AcrB